MSAPNIATLWDFETPFEDSLAGYFANVNIGGYTFGQVLTPRTNLASANYQVTPRLQIMASMVGLTPDGSGVAQASGTVGNNAISYYSLYTVAVSLGVVTSRSNNIQPHGLYRGAARQGMLEYTQAMNVNNVPYYEIKFVNPGASSQSVDAANDEILTTLDYTIDFHIPPSSLPNN